MKINSILFPKSIDPNTLESVVGVMVEVEHNGKKSVGRVKVPRCSDSDPLEARAHLLRVAVAFALEHAVLPLLKDLPLYQTKYAAPFQLDLAGTMPAEEDEDWALRGAKQLYPDWPVVLTCDNCGKKHQRWHYIETLWCDDCINGETNGAIS